MPFQVTCPNCLKILELQDSLLGKKVRCGSCQQIFLIGQPKAPAGGETPTRTVRTMVTEPGPQMQRASRSPVMLRPADDAPPPRRPRRVSRQKIPTGVWIVAGCAAGVFGVVVLAAGGFLLYRLLGLKTPSPGPTAGLQAASRQDPAPAPQPDPQAEAPPQQQPQPPDFQPRNPPRGMPPGRMPPGGRPPWAGRPPENNRPPGNNRPPEKNPEQKFPVVLSNGRVGVAIGFRRSFTISYRFEEEGPGPGQHYFVVIKTANGRAEAQITPFRIAKEGTFHLQEIGFGARDDGPFEVHLETGMPGPFGPREVVSNTIKLSP